MTDKFDLNAYIMRHIGNSHVWHLLPFLPPVRLPSFLSLHLLMLAIGVTILMFLFLVVYRKQDRVPTGITNLLEFFVVYIRDEIAIPNMGEKDGESFTPMLCSLFFFILICNLMGLFPFFTAATGNINVTGALAYLIFILMVLGTLIRSGPKGIWNGLVPEALPVFAKPIFFVLEVALLFIRCIALMMRLFANMMAGHIVIMSFLGLCIIFGLGAAILAFPMAVLFYCMEIFVSFLQAYIFILLSAIFIGHMYHPKH